MATPESIYRDRTPHSLQAFERLKESSPGGVAKGAYYYTPYPLTVDRADGCILTDVDENRYVDFVGHHTGQVLGHNHPQVMAAVRAQLERGVAVGAPMGLEKELCAELCARVASLDRVRFCNSGTEATLHAIRLARAFTGRPKIAKFEGCYHGSHDGVEISVAPPLAEAGAAEAPTPYLQTGGMAPHATADVLVLPLGDLEAAERLVASHADELAAVIFEPKAGTLDVPAETSRRVREMTERNGVLMIYDEIVAFRVAAGGAQQLFGIRPDLTTYGKVVGGGFPVGAFGGRADIMDQLDPAAGTGVGQSGTYSAHPVTVAAGLATLRSLTPEAYAHLDAMGDRLRNGLNRAFAEQSLKAVAAGVGSLFAIFPTDGEAPHDYRSSLELDRSHVHDTFLALANDGYYLPAGLGMAAISLPTTAEQIDALIAAVPVAMAAATAAAS
jgi:glutamate-1-semialdehyde 2,1-aminomutase